SDAKFLADCRQQLALISGQTPINTEAKKSISNFKYGNSSGNTSGKSCTIGKSSIFLYSVRLSVKRAKIAG
ncbi:MAG: hypothetical protein Q8755_03290, partial [Candidatus Phytoplasma australasiaticum]|nr:hypothetical protein [Candidatus Phytoplasma australasiaticum]